MLDEIEDEQRPHSVEAEPLPHLDREQPRELARMAHPGLLGGGIDMRDVGRGRRFRAGRVDHRYSPLAPARRSGATVTSKFRLVKRIVAARCAPYLPRPMLNDRSSILSLLETRRSAKPRELVGPGPTAEEMERILTIAARVPDHGKLTSVAVRHRRATTSATRSARCSAQALAEHDPSATLAHHREGGRVRPLCRAAGRPRLRARRRITRSRSGSRSCPAARRR